MESQFLLTKALAAGAVVMMRPNQWYSPETLEEMETAYLKLKEMIRAQYTQVDVDLLDIGPGSAERQQQMARQLQEAGVTEDEDILRQARLVLENITEDDPAALWASEVADEPPQHK